MTVLNNFKNHHLIEELYNLEKSIPRFLMTFYKHIVTKISHCIRFLGELYFVNELYMHIQLLCINFAERYLSIFKASCQCGDATVQKLLRL